MRDLGKETFGKVCNAARMREAEGVQVVVRCPLMEKHSQCTAFGILFPIKHR